MFFTIKPSENEEDRRKEEEEQNNAEDTQVSEEIEAISESTEDNTIKPEDLIMGPLPEEEADIEDRARKLEATRKAEDAKKIEEAKRAEKLRKEEELMRKTEEKRKLEEKRKKEEAQKLKPIKSSNEPTVVPESESLLLLGLVNLMQPALDIKMESKKYQRWIKGWDKAIEVHILNEGYMHVLIKDGSMKAAIGKSPQEPAVVMEGEYETITNYLNGELDLVLMFFDFILLRKMKLIKGLDIKLPNILSGNLIQQARDLYRIDKILKIK